MIFEIRPTVTKNAKYVEFYVDNEIGSPLDVLRRKFGVISRTRMVFVDKDRTKIKSFHVSYIKVGPAEIEYAEPRVLVEEGVPSLNTIQMVLGDLANLAASLPVSERFVLELKM